MSMCSKARLALALSFGAALCLTHGALAQELRAPQLTRIMTSTGDWGGIGLLQTRTARFAPDGAFEVGYAFVDPYKRYYISNTFFPWLEATFRYTEIRNKLYSDVPEFSHDQRYKDRGADLKLRLLSERRFVPAVAIGFQDLLGTGLFAGEYMVASKQWRDFDFSVGIGWGAIGSGGGIANPLGLGRRTGEVGAGGQLSVGDFFRGEKVGIFGGVEYQTPFAGLTLKLEYDAHGYENDILAHPTTSPYNLGIVYRPYPWLEMSVGHERGNTTMLRFSLRSDLHGPGIPKIDPPPPALTPRPTMAVIEATAPPPGRPLNVLLRIVGIDPPAPPALQEPDSVAVANALFDALSARGLEIESFSLANGEATIVAMRLSAPRETLATTAGAALSQVPRDVTALTLVEASRGFEVGRARAVREGASQFPANDPLSLRLGALGLQVEEVQVGPTSAVVTVTGRDNRPVDLTAAARAAAAVLPAVATVTVVDARSRLSETWLTGVTPSPQVAQALPVDPMSSRVPQLSALFTEGQRLTLARRLQEALIAEGVVLETVELEGIDAFVAVSAFRYPEFARNQGLTARVVANNLPAEVENITLAFLNGGLEMTRLTFRRTDLERAAGFVGTTDELVARGLVGPGLPGYPGGAVPGRYPRFSWSLSPQLRQHIGGPDRFYLFQAWLSASAGVDLFRGVSLSSQFGKNLYNNFKLLTLESDSLLPKVRSDIKHYLQEGADGNIVRMQANFLAKPAEDIYFRLTAGLLEEMYGGVSAEVLFRPFESRLALGVELSWVRQRDFDQRFKFRDYEVVTGHVSLYYDSPFRDIRIATHAGHYLAGDVGATLEVSRRFDSGVRIGAWATFTDVPPDVFGEGSFDKGFFIVIPFNVFTIQSARATGVFGFRPLTRDGGQRLVLTHRLYDLTSPASLGEVARDFDRFLQ